MPRRLYRMFSLMMAAGLVTLVVACGKKQPPAAPPPAGPPPPAPVAQQAPPPPPAQSKPQPPPPPPPSVPTEAEIFAKMTLAELNAKSPLDDVYFAYDKADLSDLSRTSLQKNADWMRKW